MISCGRWAVAANAFSNPRSLKVHVDRSDICRRVSDARCRSSSKSPGDAKKTRIVRATKLSSVQDLMFKANGGRERAWVTWGRGPALPTSASTPLFEVLFFVYLAGTNRANRPTTTATTVEKAE